MSVEEAYYMQGSRMALLAILRQCHRELGYKDEALKESLWVAEREAAFSQLIDLCARFGDTDFTSELHLADIIEKHLGDHLLGRNDKLEEWLLGREEDIAQHCEDFGELNDLFTATIGRDAE